MRNVNLVVVAFFLLSIGAGLVGALTFFPKPQEWLAPRPRRARARRAVRDWYELVPQAMESQIARETIGDFVGKRWFRAAGSVWSLPAMREALTRGELPEGVATILKVAFGRHSGIAGSLRVDQAGFERSLALAIREIRDAEESR